MLALVLAAAEFVIVVVVVLILTFGLVLIGRKMLLAVCLTLLVLKFDGFMVEATR